MVYIKKSVRARRLFTLFHSASLSLSLSLSLPRSFSLFYRLILMLPGIRGARDHVSADSISALCLYAFSLKAKEVSVKMRILLRLTAASRNVPCLQCVGSNPR